jgi:predicted enzyme related to lactoylglutathione lyase
MKLMAIQLGSDNVKALGEFYTKVFGKPMWEQGDWYGFTVDGDVGLMIGPHSEVHDKNKEPGRIMFVLQSDNVKEDFDRIKSQGAEIVAEPYQPNKDDQADVWLATFADPDGNYFQLATPWKKDSK